MPNEFWDNIKEKNKPETAISGREASRFVQDHIPAISKTQWFHIQQYVLLKHIKAFYGGDLLENYQLLLLHTDEYSLEVRYPYDGGLDRQGHSRLCVEVCLYRDTPENKKIGMSAHREFAELLMTITRTFFTIKNAVLPIDTIELNLEL